MISSLKRLLLLSGCFVTVTMAQELHTPAPQPISGTPFLWNKYPEIVFHHRLAKPVAGDTTFFIRKNVEDNSAEFIEIAFLRLINTAEIEIYAEKTEFDAGRITQSDAERVRDIMLYDTPPGSINPAKGIYYNEIDIFGALPDKDGNGKLFVLLIDVRDNYEAGKSDTYVAGYFDPLDQITGKGNYGEIIYIDTNPADAKDLGTLSIVAHELQHLIHNFYDSDEDVWVTEGFSELAPRLLGLPARSFASFLNETNRSLMDFDGSIADYAKVGLWTYYIYQRFGLGVIKKIVSNKNDSFSGFIGGLSSAGYDGSVAELLRDWFVANLLNDPTMGDGQYGYGGAAISPISSNYFHSNFTEGEQISLALNPAAAVYIQFYSGQNIEFVMNYQSSYSFGLAVIKHYETPEITFVTCNGTGTYNFSDETFGSDYAKLTIIPYWPAEIAATVQANISYSATGIGGYAESELGYDNDMLDYFIRLEDAEAAEKFDLNLSEATLSAIKILTYDSSPVTIKIYSNLAEAPLLTMSGIIPDEQAWTKIILDNPTDLADLSSFAVSVTSSGNSLGYSSAQDGFGHAYIKTDEIFHDLRNYTVTGGSEVVSLTGNWAIRAIVSGKIMIPPRIILTPDSLWFWHDEYTQTFRISNGGTEALEWEISGELPNWVKIEPLSGTVNIGSAEIAVTIDRNLLTSGFHDINIPIISNGGDESLYVSVLKRNTSTAQSALIPTEMVFSDDISRTTLPIFNIGIGSSQFAFWSEEACLAFLPSSGFIPEDDTIDVQVFLDRSAASDSILAFFFFDGVDTLAYECIYSDWQGETATHFTILNPFPNPFLPGENPLIYFPFRLTVEKPVTALIFNINGQEVYSEKINNPKIGLNVWTWDGHNQKGNPVASGVYFIVFRQGERRARQKLVLLR